MGVLINMKSLLATLFLLLVSTVQAAETVILTWQDRSTNEDGFAMEAKQPDGQWVEIARTAPDVTELAVDPDTHEAWRVRAFNVWGFSGYTNELSKDLPNGDPGALKIKSVTETTVSKTEARTTKTTIYQ
jgi:hypothetical protein